MRNARRSLGRVFARFWGLVHPTFLGRPLDRRLKRALEFTTVEVRLNQPDPSLDGLRIAYLSDLHAGHFFTAADAVELFGRVAELGPELVCLGGDLVNTEWEEVKLLGAGIDLLRPPLGVFAVPGNHEYYRARELPSWIQYLEDKGVRVLQNRGERVRCGGSTLWIGGVDDLTDGEPDVDAALAGRVPTETALLLSHHPDVFALAAQRGVDLQLSGHTHGGQIRLGRWAPVTHSRLGYVAGHYRRGDAQLYVGRGIGVVVLPLRIGPRPEVPILHLRAAAR
jgi:predicted MPP superfamily phosphohydrolase